MPIGPLDILLALIIVTLGAAVQATAGFGVALIGAPLLLLVDPSLVPGPLMAASLVLTALVGWRDRAHIDFRGLRFALTGRILGTVMAAAFLTIATPYLFDLTFGGLVLVAVVLSSVGVHLGPGRAAAVFAGGLSGLMGTISAIGGPPMALYYQRASPARLRGTLGGYFLVATTMSLAALALIGRYGATEVRLSLLLAPGMVIGFVAGSPLIKFLPEGAIRPLVLILSGAAAFVVLWRALQT